MGTSDWHGALTQKGWSAVQAHILLVEDDQDVADGLRMTLQYEGWRVEIATNGTDGLRRAAGGYFDLVILDVRLPGMDGFEVCRELRRTNHVPILFLTARGTDMDKVIGLELGGDDYLVKPFSIVELRARVRALLRRANLQVPAEQRLRVGDLLILPERQSVYRGEERIHLTGSEYTLLLTMARRPGMVFTREMLLDALWETDRNTGGPLTVNVHIGNLRERLGDDPENPRYVATVRGVGYRLVEG